MEFNKTQYKEYDVRYEEINQSGAAEAWWLVPIQFKLVSQKESVRNRRMLESKVKSWRNYLCLLASKSLNFEDEISLRGVDCNIPLNF
jgi:hypothetical protein